MRLRELGQDDYADVVAVLGRNGLRKPTRSQWDYLSNAAPHHEQLANIPSGWLLVDDREGVVGAFRNIPFLYEWNRRPIRVVVASAWAVDPAHRHRSLMLAMEYFTQGHVDVLLNTTAVAETSGKAFLAFRAEQVPQPTYTTRLLWITGYVGFAASVVRERGLPSVMRYPGALGMWIGDTSRRRRRVTDRVTTVNAFDARFDRFWEELRDRSQRLQMIRDAATLTWRFALERETPLIVVLERDGALVGYAVLVRRDQGDVRRLEVVDLQAFGDDAAILREVMSGALRIAAEQGIHLVALTGHGDAKRAALHTLAPHVKTTPGWPLYYKAADASLTEPLRSSSAWDLSLYDGDALWSAMFSTS